MLAGMERNRYADLLRVVAIGGVVYGHWLLISVIYRNGQLSGLDALEYVNWGRWVTWLFQVMPVFFLVGGYVNAQSWMAHHAHGENWTRWVRDRAMRLLWPTAVFAVLAVLAVTAATAAGVSPAEIAEASWLVALQLWFLPVYLLLIALTPLMLAAHRRWGLAVPAVMAAAAGLVDAGVVGPHLHVIGYVNYLFVWGSIHQWGFAWQDRTLTCARWRPYAMAAGGAAPLAWLLMSGSFMVDMVGSGNTNPPSIALLAFAAAQAGLVLAAEPIGPRLLARPRPWQRVRRLKRRGHDGLPVAFRTRDRHRRGLLPDRSDAPAGRRDGGVVGTAACLVRSAHRGARAARHRRHVGRAADAPPARRARAIRTLVACAPGVRHRRLDGGPGQAGDRRIRPGRAPAGACPHNMRCGPGHDPAHRPRPDRNGRTANGPPGGAAATAQSRLTELAT